IGAVQDITERKLAEARIHELAHRDALTGLPNRASFIQGLHEAIADAAPLALIKLNVDHFRDANDVLGHQASDELLKRLAAGLVEQFGDYGAVSRIGGDEFAVVLRRRPAIRRAMALAQKFIDRAKRAVRNDDIALPLSLSAGVALHPEHGATVEA